MSATRREVVRDVIADTAPGELVLLDGMRSLSDRHVTDVMTRRGNGPDTLGFGVTDAVVLVTPVVWLVVNEVVRHGVGVATDSALARLKGPLRRLLRRSDDSETVPALTAPQLEAVHARVLELAAEAGMVRENSRSLADAVVSRLAREAAAGTGRGEVGSGTGGAEEPPDAGETARATR